MTLQNRVMPTGEIIAHPARGGFMGNRGILHGDNRQLGRARWRHKNWVTCCLSFKGRRRTVMSPGHYTELFFLDEAVALAAGHRPCAECRRPDYIRFLDFWETAHGERPSAKLLDRALHAARAKPRNWQQARFQAEATGLPDGAFILLGQSAHLVLRGNAVAFSPQGYGEATPLPSTEVTVLTPAPTVAVLRAGYWPALHESASV